jgi:hypothetical protein
MREDADANHIHEHVLVQDEMNEVGHWVPQPGLHGLARVPISAMLRLKGGSQDEGGRRRQPHPRTRAGAGRDGGVRSHGPARVPISSMLRLKGGSQDEGGRRRQPHPRGAGRDGGVGHWVHGPAQLQISAMLRLKDEMKEFGLWVQPSLHGPARSQISEMSRLKVMRSPVN